MHSQPVEHGFAVVTYLKTTMDGVTENIYVILRNPIETDEGPAYFVGPNDNNLVLKVKEKLEELVCLGNDN